MSINYLTSNVVSRQLNKGFLPAGQTDDALTKVLTFLTQYIPTEVITLYIAAVSATPAIVQYYGNFNIPLYIYCLSLFVLTPLFVFLAYFVKMALAIQKAFDALPPTDPPTPRPRLIPPFLQWPWWRLVASMAAFAVWALAVPNNPLVGQPDPNNPLVFKADPLVGVLVGLVVMVVSSLLSGIESLLRAFGWVT